MDKKSLTGDVVVLLREYFLFGSWGWAGVGNLCEGVTHTVITRPAWKGKMGDRERLTSVVNYGTLFSYVFLVCNILYNLLGGHQLLCFSVRDLEACRGRKRSRVAQSARVRRVC